MSYSFRRPVALPPDSSDDITCSCRIRSGGKNICRACSARYVSTIKSIVEFAAPAPRHFLPLPVFMNMSWSWISNETSAAFFDPWRARWLAQHRIILPGFTIESGLISEVWCYDVAPVETKLALIPSASVHSRRCCCSQLIAAVLLGITEKGPCDHFSGPAFNKANERWFFLTTAC